MLQAKIARWPRFRGIEVDVCGELRITFMALSCCPWQGATETESLIVGDTVEDLDCHEKDLGFYSEVSGEPLKVFE